MTSGVLALPAKEKEREAGYPWIALSPLALIPFLGTSPQGLIIILLAVQVLFLFLGVRRPVWILAALLASELTIFNYGYLVGELRIANRLILYAACIPVVLPHLVRQPPRLGPRAKPLLVLALAFLVLSMLANLIYTDSSQLIKFSGHLATGLLALTLVPAIIQNRDDLVHLGLAALTIGVVAALVGILQHYTSSGAPLYAVVPHPGIPDDLAVDRSQGLSASPVHYANALLLVAMPLLGVTLLAPVEPLKRVYLAIALLMILAALYFSYTRSAVLAGGIGLLAIALLYQGRYKREVWLLVGIGAVYVYTTSWVWTAALALVAIALFYKGLHNPKLWLALMALGLSFFWYSGELSESRYSRGLTETSAASRPILWTTGLNIVLDHPFLGIGHDRFQEISPDYTATVSPEILERQGEGESVIGRLAPHNDYLNVWISFGSVAFVLYLGMLVLAAKNFVEAYFATSDRWFKAFAIGGLGALVAFAFNSAFHNYFDFNLTMWLLAGFSLAMAKLVLAQSPRTQGSLEGGPNVHPQSAPP